MDPSCVDFDVTFTDGTTTRITVRERRFPGDTASHFEVDGAPGGLSPERAVSSWAWHRLMARSIDGDHGSGVASIVRADDWRGCPSPNEALAHNGRTGGDCFGPWLWREHDDATVVVRMVAVCGDGTLDIGDDLPRAGQWRPITRAGACLPWPAPEAAAVPAEESASGA